MAMNFRNVVRSTRFVRFRWRAGVLPSARAGADAGGGGGAVREGDEGGGACVVLRSLGGVALVPEAVGTTT